MKPVLPPIGFGTWQLIGSDAHTALLCAIKCGYRLIDTAASYGNETTIKRVLKSCDTVREDLYISGKLWNSKRKYKDAITACKQSLKRLGLEYFDLFLVHWPASPVLHQNWRETNAECWFAMETIYRDGLARSIGVCNYLPHHLDELKKTAKLMPAINQIELHPGFLNSDTLEYCKKRGIAVQAWSPLGSGSLLHNESITTIAAKYQKTPAQICLRWCVQHGAVPLPKSAKPERIRENYDIFSFELSRKDMTTIDSLPFSGGFGYDPDTITIFG